jgi:hypothetical protein
VLASGCLGHLYEVPRAELERLVQEPPPQRGERIHAVQQFSTASEPERAPPWEPALGVPPPGYSLSVHGHWVPNVYLHYGAPSYVPPRHYHDASPVTSPSSGGGSGNVGSIGSIGDVDELLVLAIVVGVAVGIGVTASEGARYDGLIAVHPHHPVHLQYESGEQRVIALDELTPEHLWGVDRAVVSGYEGAGLWLRGAAPLNRRGFSYQFGAGDDGLLLPGGQLQRGLGFRFAFGYFPLKQLGLLAESRILRGDDGQDQFYNARLGVEGQWYPVHLWRLHLGAYAGVGQAWSASTGATLPTMEEEQTYFSFGVLTEMELNTRLGLTFRWGQDWLPTAGTGSRGVTSAWSVGLAIY